MKPKHRRPPALTVPLSPPDVKKAFDASFESEMTRKLAEASAPTPPADKYGNLGMRDRLFVLRRNLEKLIDEATFVIDAIDNTTSKL